MEKAVNNSENIEKGIAPTEKINLYNLTEEQIGKLFPIRIMPYNSDWKMIFEQEKSLLISVLSENLTINVEHIGSTAVDGLAAKPTIDILIEVSTLNNDIKQVIIQKLEIIGYQNMYNAEKDNKMTLGKGYNENYLYTHTYHVHIREKGDTKQDEIYFRDYLCQNSDARNEYEKLKYELAQKYKFNREDYTKAKTEFIIRITEQQKKIEKNMNDKSLKIKKGGMIGSMIGGMKKIIKQPENQQENSIKNDTGGMVGGTKGGIKNGTKITKELVLFLVQKYDTISISDIAEILKINRSAAQKHISNLKKENIIRREGSTKYGKWIIVQEVENKNKINR